MKVNELITILSSIPQNKEIKMSIKQDRLFAVLRIAVVLKNNIIANNNIYDPMLAPNFQSIFDVAVGLTDEQFLQHVTEDVLQEMEQWRLPHFARPFIWSTIGF